MFAIEQPKHEPFPIIPMLGLDEQGSPLRLVLCPICRCEYASTVGARWISGEDNYRAGWEGRGDLMVVRFAGECDHEFEICFGFHKGNTYVFARAEPPAAAAELLIPARTLGVVVEPNGPKLRVVAPPDLPADEWTGLVEGLAEHKVEVLRLLAAETHPPVQDDDK